MKNFKPENPEGPVIELRQDGLYSVYVADSKAAQTINRRLRKYDTDLEAEASEGNFQFGPDSLAFVRAVIKGLEKAG